MAMRQKKDGNEDEEEDGNKEDKEDEDEETDADISKIKKVQSFFRGWLCRRRWKRIVDEYIRSPHAESMRKRNW